MTISIDRNADRGIGAGVDTDQTVHRAKTIYEKGFTRNP